MSNYAVASGRAKQNYVENWTQLKPLLLVGLWFKIKINVSKGWSIFRKRMETLHLYIQYHRHTITQVGGCISFVSVAFL